MICKYILCNDIRYEHKEVLLNSEMTAQIIFMGEVYALYYNSEQMACRSCLPLLWMRTRVCSASAGPANVSVIIFLAMLLFLCSRFTLEASCRYSSKSSSQETQQIFQTNLTLDWLSILLDGQEDELGQIKC